jgi:multidrug resistance efflux pump
VNKKTVLVALLVLAAAAAGVAVFWSFNNGDYLQLPGIVEIQEVRLGSKIGGRVGQVLIAEGKIATRKQKLVLLEAPELENMREQQKARVQAAEAEVQRTDYGARVEEKRAAQAAAEAAKARYDKMAKGWREEEKRSAKSDYEAAEADLKQAMDDLNRAGELYRIRQISRAEYDAALAARDRARGRTSSAKARADMLMLGNREEDVAEAKADWQKAQAKAKLQEIEINLREAEISVPDAPQFNKAIVEVVPVRPGDIVAANQPVVRLLCVDDLWVKIFVPETQFGLITIGKEVEITIDSHPGKIFKGVVIQRASISEFTPRNVQSVDERRHQVFGVKIRVDDPEGVFSAGMAANVKIPLTK